MDLIKKFENMDDNDLVISLSTKSHVLLFLTDLKEIDYVTKELNLIQKELKSRGIRIGVSNEPEKRRH